MAGNTRRTLQKASMSRVFTIEDRAGPSRTPVFQELTRAGAPSLSFGDITPVRTADPTRYGQFVIRDIIQGQAGLPTFNLEARSTMALSAYLKLAKKGCPVDIQVHHGTCKDPSDFDLGWEKVDVFEEARFTSVSESELGTFDADGEAAILEMLDLTAIDWYQLKNLNFTEIATAEIVQEVVDVVICDSRACGNCGLPSDGVQRVFAVQTSVGASPGITSEVVSSIDGGTTWQETNITSLAANQSATAMACVGAYLVIVSSGDDSIQYAPIADVLADTATWTEVTTGIVGAGSPSRILSLSRTKTWIVGEAGYIYFTDDITTGVTVQTAGAVTSANLTAISALDDQNLLVGGLANAILKTENGGITWSLVTGPSAQAAVNVTSAWMLSQKEWYLTYSDGELWYTIDGGVNWLQRTLPGSLTSISDIKFATRTVGYIAGNTATVGKLLRTINGGRSWYVLPEQVGSAVPTALRYNRIAVSGDDPNVIYAGGVKTNVGDGILVKGA